MRLKDKVAIVTGGNRGIGKAISLALAKEGANIVIAAQNEKTMKATCEEVKKLGVDCIYVKTDVSKSLDVKNMIKKTKNHFKKIDILINNAGVAIRKTLEKTTEKEYDWIMDVNVKGIFLCTKEVVLHMIKQKSGTIINISSGAGKTGFPELSVYGASKFGVIGITESLAAEVNEYGIKVYAVCPGATDTDMFRSMYPELEPTLKPEDIAKKVLMLCLPNRYSSGSSIEVYD